MDHGPRLLDRIYIYICNIHIDMLAIIFFNKYIHTYHIHYVDIHLDQMHILYMNILIYAYTIHICVCVCVFNRLEQT